MCLPWNHKWETISTTSTDVYAGSDWFTDQSMPIGWIDVIKQRCNRDLGGCGKEIVRKYRV